MRGNNMHNPHFEEPTQIPSKHHPPKRQTGSRCKCAISIHPSIKHASHMEHQKLQTPPIRHRVRRPGTGIGSDLMPIDPLAVTSYHSRQGGGDSVLFYLQRCHKSKDTVISLGLQRKCLLSHCLDGLLWDTHYPRRMD